MVTLRVSRRAALAAAAGWVAAPVRVEAGEPADLEDGPRQDVPPATGGRVFPLYRELAAFLRDPDRDRPAALRRALDTPRGRAASVAHGGGLAAYLLEQTAGHTAADAAWAERSDAADVSGQVRDGLRRARRLLGAEEAPPVFLIFSRRFDGRTDGRAIFFGVDRFGDERLRDAVSLLSAHEYNHVVRARVESFATLVGGIIAEGLATACSELAEPGRPLHQYLLYSAAQLGWFTPERLARLRREVESAHGSADPALRRAFLAGGAAGPFGAPSRSGYYLGYLAVRAWLARGVPIDRLTRMSAAEIWAGAGDGG